MFRAPAIQGGRRPLRTSWTYSDGTTVGPDDDRSTSGLFRNMIKSLTGDELRLLDSFVQRELFSRTPDRSQAPDSTEPAAGPVTALNASRGGVPSSPSPSDP